MTTPDQTRLGLESCLFYFLIQNWKHSEPVMPGCWSASGAVTEMKMLGQLLDRIQELLLTRSWWAWAECQLRTSGFLCSKFMDPILGPVASYVQAQWLQSCLTLCNPMNHSPPGSSVHGILLARILEWVAMPSSRGSSPHRVQTCVSCIAGRFFTSEPPGEPPGSTCPCTINSIYGHMVVVKESAPLFQGTKQGGEWLRVWSTCGRWEMEYFLLLSVNKDVRVISNCRPPLWALREFRKEQKTCYIAAIRPEPLPMMDSEETKLRMWEQDTGPR